MYLLSLEFPTSTGPPPTVGALFDELSVALEFETVGVDEALLDGFNRGCGRTGISLGTAAFGEGLDLGLAFAVGFGLLDVIKGVGVV